MESYGAMCNVPRQKAFDDDDDDDDESDICLVTGLSHGLQAICTTCESVHRQESAVPKFAFHSTVLMCMNELIMENSGFCLFVVLRGQKCRFSIVLYSRACRCVFPVGAVRGLRLRSRNVGSMRVGMFMSM